MEAEYALDDRSPLDLFNCLVPKLYEHRRFSLKKDEKFSIADFKSQQAVFKLQLQIQKDRLPQLEKENGMLLAKVEQLENELQIVQWYLEVLEQGLDTK